MRETMTVSFEHHALHAAQTLQQRLPEQREHELDPLHAAGEEGKEVVQERHHLQDARLQRGQGAVSRPRIPVNTSRERPAKSGLTWRPEQSRDKR